MKKGIGSEVREKKGMMREVWEKKGIRASEII